MQQLVQSHDGVASLVVAGEVIEEELYSTIIPYDGELPSNILRSAYTFGPQREFSGPLIIMMKHDGISEEPTDPRSLSIHQLTSSGWISLKSYYDDEKNVILTSVRSLGTFAVGINEFQQTEVLPRTFLLEQNFPNPFNPRTTLSFLLGHPSFVSLKLYNMAGEEVATLVNEMKTPGWYTVQWDASGYASGVYLYRLQVGNAQQTKKMILLR